MIFTKKRYCSLIVLFFFFTVAFGQKKEVFFACNYTSNSINEKAICDMLGFQTRPEAQKAVENIVRRSGLKQNFYVMECPNIDNCFAATRNGERLIVYDAGFMKRINGLTKTDWGAMSVLAHEIGHHLQGHTLKQSGSDPQKELEADEFSGFVMYQMGASLKEAQSAIFMLTTDQDYGTHPPRRKRLSSIAKGYSAAEDLYPRVNISDNSVDKVPINAEKSPQENKKAIVFDEPEVIRTPKNPEIVKIRTGCIDGTCKNGFGVAVNHKTYERYEGNWNNGRRSGYGIEYYADGLKKYEGNFSGSVFQGFGSYFYKNGDKYVGNFKRGTPNDDNGIYYYQNGDRLFVRFENGKKEGKAKKIFYSGVQKTIYFKNDVELLY